MDALFLSALPSSDEISDELPIVYVSSTTEVSIGTLGEQVVTCFGKSIVLIMPASFFSFFVVDLPAVKPHWLRQAATYALEELVAESVDEMHFAVGQKKSIGSYDVIAVRKSTLKMWLNFFESRGVFIAAIYVDADLLPKDGDFLLCRDNMIFSGKDGVRGGFGYAEYSVYHSYLEKFTFLNSSALSVENEPQKFSNCASSGGTESSYPYAYLAANLHLGTNVAQGEFSLNRSSRAMGAWRGVFLYGVCLLLLWIVFNYCTVRYFDGVSRELYADSLAIYRKAFPEDLRIVNLRAQLDSRLNGVKEEGRESIVSILSIIEAQVATIPSLEVASFSWNAEKGVASLGMRSSEFADLELLRKKLGGEGYTVLMGSATKEEGKAMAELSVSGFGK